MNYVIRFCNIFCAGLAFYLTICNYKEGEYIYFLLYLLLCILNIIGVFYNPRKKGK